MQGDIIVISLPMEGSMKERRAVSANGIFVLVLLLALGTAAVWYGIRSIVGGTLGWIAGIVVIVGVGIAASGFTIISPNQSHVVTFLGKYLGTVRENGFRWTVPITRRRRISLRMRNFDSSTLKVNDANGNPVEVAAVIVWRVIDTAKAGFEVDDYESFVQIQTEAAVRHMASLYPYDSYETGQKSLQANADEVTTTLHEDLQEHLFPAGVEVVRTQLRRLAYAPEIAGDMLRRQQAEAVVAARRRIVEGAVGMVDHALELLSDRGIIQLDEERKAAMVSNLLVVLCSETRNQPVVNTGTLYT
jgi:regulator of protease activity HflC (stomatin/prohibitin superfamily)